MKTRKRLQAILLVMAMLAAVLGSVTVVSADEELPGPYQASEAFVFEYGKQTNGQWACQYLDLSGEKPEYKSMAYNPSGANELFKSTTLFPIAEGSDGATADEIGRAYRRNSSVNSTAKVGKFWMAPDSTGSDGTKYRAVRTFIVPQNGNVTITAANGIPGYNGKIRGRADKGNNHTIVRLVKTDEHNTYSEQLWPITAGDNTTAIDGTLFAVVPTAGSVDFPPITVNVQKDERLCFEVGTDFGGSDWPKVGAYWDPVITYNSLSFILPQYQSSKAFVAAAGNNHPEPWMWEYYDTGSAEGKEEDGSKPANYKLLTIVNETLFGDKTNFPVPDTDGTDGGFAFRRADAGNDQNTAAVGKYWMTPDKYLENARKRYYAVRTFVARESGNVTVSAAGMSPDEENKIYGQKKDSETEKASIRITLDDGETVTKIWPKDKDWQGVLRSGSIDFSPLTLNLKKGEKLHFELRDNIGNIGSPNWDMAVYWDPVITYNKALVTGEVTFGGVSEEASMDAVAQALTEGEVTVTVPVTACYMTVDSITPLAAVYDSAGMLVSCGVGEKKALGMNQSADLTVTLPKIEGDAPTDGYIKVFLWDSTENLTPLSDLGGAPVLGVASEPDGASYIGTGQPG